jgi:hypothetical protein
MKTVLVKRRLVRLETKVLHTSGYADDAIVRCVCRGQEYSFLEKPFTRKSMSTLVHGRNGQCILVNFDQLS